MIEPLTRLGRTSSPEGCQLTRCTGDLGLAFLLDSRNRLAPVQMLRGNLGQQPRSHRQGGARLTEDAITCQEMAGQAQVK